MGGNQGKYSRIYHDNKEIKKLKTQFDLLGLKESDVGKLYETYLDIDFDNSGTILLAELLSYILSEETVFVRKIFSTFDTDESKYLDFREFVISIWNYCTLNPKNLAAYSFSLFDLNDNGVLDKKEIHKMLLEMYGKHYQDSIHAKRLYAKLQELKMNSVDEDFFIEFAQSHPAMLYPATVFQNSLKERIVNEKFWIKQMNWRDTKYKKYRPIEYIIQFNEMMQQPDKLKNMFDMTRVGVASGATDQRAPPPRESSTKENDNIESFKVVDVDDNLPAVKTDHLSVRRKSVDKKRRKSVEEHLQDKDLALHEHNKSSPNKDDITASTPPLAPHHKSSDSNVTFVNNSSSGSGHKSTISPTNGSPDRAVVQLDPLPPSVKNHAMAIMTIDSIDSAKTSVKTDPHRLSPDDFLNPSRPSRIPLPHAVYHEDKKKDKTFGKPRESTISKFIFGEPRVNPSFSEDESKPSQSFIQRVASWKSNSSNDSGSMSPNIKNNKIPKEKPLNLTINRASSKSLLDPSLIPALSKKYKMKPTAVHVLPKR